jgi:AraC-like DNA-binding protein
LRYSWFEYGRRCSGESAGCERDYAREHRVDHGAATMRMKPHRNRARPTKHPRRGNRTSLPERPAATETGPALGGRTALAGPHRIVDADRVRDLPYTERGSRVAGAVLWKRQLADPAVLRVLPDGCLDLIWRDGSLVVAGPDRHAFVTTSEAGTSFKGLRLPPGMGPAVLGVPADRLVGQRIPLGDLWTPALARRAADAVAASGAAALEDVVMGRLAEREPDPLMAAVVRALDAGRGVHEIALRLGLSERQLHRRSLAAFGYGAKTLGRIRRMQRALAMPVSASGATAAAQAGYADQAHLARDVRDLAGVPFSALRAA